MTNMLNDPWDLTDISVQKNRKKKDKETLKNRTIEDKSSKTKNKNWRPEHDEKMKDFKNYFRRTLNLYNFINNNNIGIIFLLHFK